MKRSLLLVAALSMALGGSAWASLPASDVATSNQDPTTTPQASIPASTTPLSVQMGVETLTTNGFSFTHDEQANPSTSLLTVTITSFENNGKGGERMTTTDTMTVNDQSVTPIGATRDVVYPSQVTDKRDTKGNPIPPTLQTTQQGLFVTLKGWGATKDAAQLSLMVDQRRLVALTPITTNGVTFDFPSFVSQGSTQSMVLKVGEAVNLPLQNGHLVVHLDKIEPFSNTAAR